MLTFQWIATAMALLLAGAALVRARRATRRLERLSESYWQLRYECGQLNARLTRIEAPALTNPPPSAGPRPEAATVAFVPLSALRR